jgi:hypothetical protein
MIEQHPTKIDCWIDSDHPERGEFWARPNMDERAVRAEWESAFNPSPEQQTQDARGAIRHERDRLLRESDWTQLADSPVDKARWAIYRQQLRDLPANTPDPAKPNWPRRPDDTADPAATERELDRAARTVLFDGKN